MADVTGAKIDWQNVSAADYEAGNARAVNNRLTAARLNALGQAIRNVNDELGGGLDLSDAPVITWNRTTSDTGPRFQSILNGDLDLELADISQTWVNGKRVSWQNEWGAWRGCSPHTWGDAAFRAIREQGDGIIAGRAVELVDRRNGAGTNPMWGRKWRDGMLVRYGIDMSDTWIRNGSEAIPSELPEGTIVVQI